MSDSGFPPVPPGNSGSIPGPTRPGAEPEDAQPARIEFLPRELREVRHPLRLKAEIVAQNRDGSVRVRTAQGDIDIRLPPESPPPKPGEKIEIEIRPGNPPQQAVIRELQPEIPRPAAPTPPVRPAETPVDIELTAPSRPPATEPPPQNRPEPIQPQDIVRILPLAANLAPDIVQAITEIITSTLIQRAELAAQIIVTPPQTPQPVTDFVHATPAAPPPPAQAPIISLSQPTAPIIRVPLPPLLEPVLHDFPALQTPQAPIPDLSFAPPLRSFLTPPVPDIPSPFLPPPKILSPTLPSQPFEARIDSIVQPDVLILPPGEKTQVAAPQIATPNPAAAIVQGNPDTKTGQVVGFIQKNMPVISFGFFAAPDGEQAAPIFVIQTPESTLPVGTQIQIAPQPGAPAIGVATLPPLNAALPATAFLAPEPTWPVLDQIYQALTHAAPQLAQALANVTPNAAASPSQLGPAALFFLAAIRSGDIAGWLGDKAADILRRDGKANLISRLSQEGSILNRIAAEPASQDWRGFSVPHFWEGQIHKMAVYYKNDGGNETDREQGKQTRFIFDLSLTRMGKVQLDGLFRASRLDLVVRTETPLSQAMQMEMKRTYAGAIGQTRLAGELSFQNRPEQWVKINPQAETYSANI